MAIPFLLQLRIQSTFFLGIIPVRLPVYTSICVICMCTFVTYLCVWVSSQELVRKCKDIWFDFLIFLKPLPRECLLIKSYVFIHSISADLHLTLQSFLIYFHVNNVRKGFLFSKFIFFSSKILSLNKKKLNCVFQPFIRSRIFYWKLYHKEDCNLQLILSDDKGK